MENIFNITPTTKTKLEDGTTDYFYDCGEIKLLINMDDFGNCRVDGTDRSKGLGCRGTLQLFRTTKEKKTRFELKDLPKGRRLGPEEIIKKGDLFVFENGFEVSDGFEESKALFDFNDSHYYLRPEGET